MAWNTKPRHYNPVDQFYTKSFRKPSRFSYAPKLPNAMIFRLTVAAALPRCQLVAASALLGQ